MENEKANLNLACKHDPYSDPVPWILPQLVHSGPFADFSTKYNDFIHSESISAPNSTNITSVTIGDFRCSGFTVHPHFSSPAGVYHQLAASPVNYDVFPQQMISGHFEPGLFRSNVPDKQDQNARSDDANLTMSTTVRRGSSSYCFPMRDNDGSLLRSGATPLTGGQTPAPNFREKDASPTIHSRIPTSGQGKPSHRQKYKARLQLSLQTLTRTLDQLPETDIHQIRATAPPQPPAAAATMGSRAISGRASGEYKNLRDVLSRVPVEYKRNGKAKGKKRNANGGHGGGGKLETVMEASHVIRELREQIMELRSHQTKVGSGYNSNRHTGTTTGIGGGESSQH